VTRDEHIEAAERLLESAKDVAKLKSDNDVDRKANQATVLDLLDFARTHATIAQAIVDGGVVSQLANIASAMRHAR
jgi:hypothetical protein